MKRSTVAAGILTIIVITLFVNTIVQADEKKGQRIIIKKLKVDCGFDGGELARKHTQAEWKKFYDNGNLPEEIQTICPASKPLKDSYYQHLYDFLHNFALDSGNVPSC